MTRRVIIRDESGEHRVTVDEGGVVLVDGAPVHVKVMSGGEVRVGETGSVRA